MTSMTTTFYLAARSADKPPGKGVHETLAAGEDFTDLAREQNWRRRLFALQHHEHDLAPADLALLLMTKTAELVAAGRRCEALERVRNWAAEQEEEENEEEEEEEDSSAATTAAEEIMVEDVAAVAADDTESVAADDTESVAADAADDAEADDAEADDADDTESDAADDAESDAADDAESDAADDAESDAADDAESDAADDAEADDTESDAAHDAEAAEVIDLVALEDKEAAAEALADMIAAELVGTSLTQLARRFGGQAAPEDRDEDHFDFDESVPPAIHVPAARLRVLYQLAAHDGRRVLVRWLHHTVGALEGDDADKWDGHATLIAAERGHRAALEFLLDEGCPADPTALCAAAAHGGHYDLLRLFKEDYEAGWDERCVEAVVSGGGDRFHQQSMLRKCLAQNAPVRPRALRLAVQAGDLVSCKLLHQHLKTCPALLIATAANEDWLALAAAAPPGGDPIGVLVWLTEATPPLQPICCEWKVSVAAAAARRPDPSVLAWLRARGCPMDPSVALAAAQALRPDNLALCLRGGGGVHAAQAHQAATSALLTNGGGEAEEEDDKKRRESDRAACIALLQPLLVAQQAFFAPRRRAAAATDMRQWMLKEAAHDNDGSSSAKRAKR